LNSVFNTEFTNLLLWSSPLRLSIPVWSWHRARSQYCLWQSCSVLTLLCLWWYKVIPISAGNWYKNPLDTCSNPLYKMMWYLHNNPPVCFKSSLD
jgi:hypothetical protein